MSDPRFEAGVAALVDLYLHTARIAGGADRIFSNPAKAEAASYFVATYQKQIMDAGPQPTRSGRVTNFYDEPRLPPASVEPAPTTEVLAGEVSPAIAPTDPAPADVPPAVVGDESSITKAPPSVDAVAALLNEDED